MGRVLKWRRGVETYLRARPMFPVKFRIPLLAVVLSLVTFVSRGQGCADALGNYLCADSALPPDSLQATPFSFACMNVQQSYFYSFHTNSIASSTSMTITVNNRDCDDDQGNDSLYVMVVQLQPNGDPCSPADYIGSTCFADSSQSFSTELSGLADSQDYIVIVGSNHNSIYGPCNFDVNIAGDAVDVVAGIDPLLVSLGNSAQLSVSGADTVNASVNWSPPQFLDNPSSPNPTATPEETTSFEVTATVGNCELTDVITLTVGPPIIVFNTFTPNGDGINDTWKIKDIERFENCQVEVFDRWGQSLFKSVGYKPPWDGTYKGREIPTAAYYYVIELNSLEVTIPPLTGTVNVVH